MKNLNQKSTKVFNVLFTKFNSELDATKKENLQNEIIAKFGEDNFNNGIKLLSKVDAPKKSKKSASDALSNSKGLSELEINHSLLSALNAIGITDKIKENNGKSIFKKEFNNKTDRTKCRNSFQNAIGVYLVHLAHNKIELAQGKLSEIKSIANKYYIAESTFKSKSDYCTDNMDANKKELISLFISSQIIVDAPKKEIKKRITKKKVDAIKESEVIA